MGIAARGKIAAVSMPAFIPSFSGVRPIVTAAVAAASDEEIRSVITPIS